MHIETFERPEETEPLSSLIIPDYVDHLVGAVPGLPICNPSDIANIERAKRGLHPTWLPYTPQRSSGYAWQRHPRYVAEYEEVLKRFIEENPFAEVLWLDEACSITLLKSSVKATWLRDCGDRVQRAISGELFSSLPRTPEYSHLKEVTSDKTSAIRRALTSYAQIALYTIPVEMSRRPDEIEQYLASSIAFMTSFAKQRLRNGHERRDAIQGDSQVTISGSSMEERWRVDTILFDNPNRQTLLEMLSVEEYVYLPQDVAREVRDGFDMAKEAEQDGEHLLAKNLRESSKLRSQDQTVSRAVGLPTSAGYAAQMSNTLAAYFIREGQASPARFFSIDMAPPSQIANWAVETLDIDTLASGAFRRSKEELLRGDPTHITAPTSEGIKKFKDGSLMFIGSFEGAHFYRELPSSLREIRRTVEEATEDFRLHVQKLHKGGVYVSFPWDVVESTAEEDSKGDPEQIKSLRIIRRRFLDRVYNNIKGFSDGEVDIRWHTLQELFGWMTPAETEHLVPTSPVFKKYLGKDPTTTKVPTLIFTKTV